MTLGIIIGTVILLTMNSLTEASCGYIKHSDNLCVHPTEPYQGPQVLELNTNCHDPAIFCKSRFGELRKQHSHGSGKCIGTEVGTSRLILRSCRRTQATRFRITDIGDTVVIQQVGSNKCMHYEGSSQTPLTLSNECETSHNHFTMELTHKK